MTIILGECAALKYLCHNHESLKCNIYTQLNVACILLIIILLLLFDFFSVGAEQS
jgi:hypothetical protein